MSHSIGQVIKSLRKERNFTQEELAEQLNISSQAVSKWENETSMPDISQIVPLANVFGISTDILFGTYGINDDEEVTKIIDNAWKLNSRALEDKRNVYEYLQNELRRYPNNVRLLMQSLELGISLAYPENDCYDEENGQAIYQECIRQANIVCTYAKNAGDILRTHMIMVSLHSAYGNIDKAWEHAEKFPTRSDMTFHAMSAFIAHAEKSYKNEALYWQWDIFYHLEAIFDSIVRLGESYRFMENYEDALKMFKSVFDLIELVFADEKYLPPLHNRERGDVHCLIARTYLEIGDTDKAMDWLEKMYEYDVNVRSQFTKDMRVETPFLREVNYAFYNMFYDNIEMLKEKLNNAEFECLMNNERFAAVYKKLK